MGKRTNYINFGWEGSLDGRIGWFPADFVGIVKNGSDGKVEKKGGLIEGQNGGDQHKLESNRMAFRAQLVKEFLVKERENLESIERTMEALRNLARESNEIGRKELVGESIGKLAEFVHFKRKLLGQMEEETKKTMQNQKIGQLFLDVAPEMRNNLRQYCGKHCDLVKLLNRKIGGGGMVDLKGLVLGLSLVFRHVQKYGAMLREIERNTPEAHSDRGNLLRASKVYLEFHEECELVRKQREAQLDFLESGVLQTNFGSDFEKKLGKLLYIGKVGVLDGNVNLLDEEEEVGEEEAKELDRCISIFSSTILLLEMQMPSGKFLLKNRFGTADLVIKQFDSKNAIQLKKGKDALIIKSVGKRDHGQLLDALRESCVAQMSNGEKATSLRKKSQKREANLDQLDCSIMKTAATTIGNIRVDHKLEMIMPDGILPTKELGINSANISNQNGQKIEESNSKLYSGWALRPMPPQRATWFPDGDLEKLTQQIKLRKGLSAVEQEDALLLKIVEGYRLSGPGGGPSSTNTQFQHCCVQRQRHRNSADSCHSPCGGGTVQRAASYPDHPEMGIGRHPQLIVAEEEKIFVEEIEGDQLVIKEKSLVDTVYALKDQLSALTKEVATIAKSLEHEQRARRRMEEYIRQNENNEIINDANANTKVPIALSKQPSSSMNSN